jgi:hypothetical protein
MAENRSSISRATTYAELGEFWDSHDLGEVSTRLRPAKFEVAIKYETTYYPVDAALSETIRDLARKRGISPDVLLNLWVQEKVEESRK